VRADAIDAFREATVVNAANSLREPGVARFDVIQQQDDTTRFVLVEAYRTPGAIAAHKDTAHYAAWRDTVAPMMAGPRSSTKYTNVFPEDEGYGMRPGPDRP
jgi:quinol monooxygenase YgiN